MFHININVGDIGGGFFFPTFFKKVKFRNLARLIILIQNDSKDSYNTDKVTL